MNSEFVQKYKLPILIVLALLLIYLIYNWKSEKLTDPFYLDQMAMEYDDPAIFMYTGREKDVSGMDMKDYYLENQMNSSSGAGPQYLKNNTNFIDHTDFMGIPIKTRPLRNPSATALQKQANLISNNLEEYAFKKLN
jgi:hypothetical protein